ncbi:helix-turn-helix domain-containing protein [Microbacterium sp. LWO12-1.2]|uniref:helix-turn-helix domain-containing protein n=1 Tax=Microbacterium sp. LWO12-1.2 TaxID=3135261 RepID=UPI00343D1BA1
MAMPAFFVMSRGKRHAELATSDSSTTVERSIALLWELYANPEGLSASDLARRLDTQRTALYRLLRPFLRTQFIRRDDRKRYYLGFGITALARAVAEPIENLVRDSLQKLADDTDCSAMIIADTDGILVTVASAGPQRPGMHVAAPPGFVHENNDVALRAIDAGRGVAATEPLADAAGFSNAIGGLATTIALPLHVPIIGSDACILLASVTPFRLDDVLPLLSRAVEEVARSQRS